MAVYTEQTARANIRIRNGKRVFFLAQGDHLTPSARMWLCRDGVEIVTEMEDLPAAGAPQDVCEHGKPEDMTHLNAQTMVPKTHPRIRFRGMLDQLQAEILLCAAHASGQRKRELEDMLGLVRKILRCEVLDQPWKEETICGFSEKELREQSQFPQKYFGQPHFMPTPGDSDLLLQLNRLRTIVRATELGACRAMPHRTDLIRLLNRLSSLVWIWMIRLKKEEDCGRQN